MIGEIVKISTDPNFYECPKCAHPLDPTLDDEWKNTGGGITCVCGAFVALPYVPVPRGSVYRDRYTEEG